MLRGSSIGLTSDLLVAVVRPEKSPASSGGAPGTRMAARGRTGLNHVLHGEPPCSLGKVLGGCLGSEDRRRGECGGGGPEAAAGARAPVIVWLGLINKWLGEVL
jgi:hypothetical protein